MQEAAWVAGLFQVLPVPPFYSGGDYDDGDYDDSDNQVAYHTINYDDGDHNMEAPPPAKNVLQGAGGGQLCLLILSVRLLQSVFPASHHLRSQVQGQGC